MTSPSSTRGNGASAPDTAGPPEAQRLEREREALLAVGQAATTTSNLGELAETAVRLLHERLKYAATTLFLAEPKARRLTLYAQLGIPKDARGPMESYPLDPDHPAIAVRTYYTQTTLVVRDLQAREELTHAIRFIRARGLHTLVSVPIIANDECLGVLQVATDDSAGPPPSEIGVLRMAAHHLALAIRQKRLLDELGLMVTELQRANRELDAFAHTVSHDLREPLRSISNFADFLSADHGALLPQEGQHYLERIRAGAQRMYAMLESLLSYAHLGREMENASDIDLNLLMLDVVESLDALVKERKGRIEAPEPMPRLRAPRNRLQTVLLNLASNGLKFNQAPEPVVRVGCDARESVHEFWVEDNGIGIPAEARERVFKLFTRLPEARRHPGTGAGLAIAAKCVEQMGGRIWIEDGRAGGTCVRFTIPHARQETTIDRHGQPPAARIPSPG